MKKYETPVMTVTVIESDSVITLSGLAANASTNSQTSIDKIDINY